MELLTAIQFVLPQMVAGTAQSGWSLSLQLVAVPAEARVFLDAELSRFHKQDILHRKTSLNANTPLLLALTGQVSGVFCYLVSGDRLLLDWILYGGGINYMTITPGYPHAHFSFSPHTIYQSSNFLG